MPTPHNSAAPGDYAPAVLMPGDPRRARRIAETLFDDARLVNEVRGMEAYTGTVGGRPISVMGSGMGMPTMTIYATELYREYGVQRIIRVGTCGGSSFACRVRTWATSWLWASRKAAAITPQAIHIPAPICVFARARFIGRPSRGRGKRHRGRFRPIRSCR